jgi:hypothetical protein
MRPGGIIAHGIPHLLPALVAQRIIGTVTPVTPAADRFTVAQKINQGIAHRCLAGIKMCNGRTVGSGLAFFQEFQCLEEFTLQAIHNFAALFVIVNACVRYRRPEIFTFAGLEVTPGKFDHPRPLTVDKNYLIPVYNTQVLHGSDGNEEAVTFLAGKQQVNHAVMLSWQGAQLAPDFGTSLKTDIHIRSPVRGG